MSETTTFPNLGPALGAERLQDYYTHLLGGHVPGRAESDLVAGEAMAWGVSDQYYLNLLPKECAEIWEQEGSIDFEEHLIPVGPFGLDSVSGVLGTCAVHLGVRIGNEKFPLRTYKGRPLFRIEHIDRLTSEPSDGIAN